jgi:flagellar basal body-associated protein FliL
MAKPLKPKNLKPQAKADAPSVPAPADTEPVAQKNKPTKVKGLTMIQTIILAVVMLISSIVGPALTLYFLGPTVLVPMIQQALPQPEGEEGEEGEKHAEEGKAGEHGKKGEHGEAKASGLGLNLPMEEFIVNLKTSQGTKGNQFLKAKMSLAVGVPVEEDCHALGGEHGAEGEAKAEGGGGHGGGEAAAIDPVTACNEAFVKKMEAYTPTLRDIINTALMKRTATQISTLEGQEDLKDELVQEMNAVLTNHGYTVQRINLQDFVLQR